MGLARPLPACSATDPCTRLLFTYERRGIRAISAPIDTPQCRTGAAAAAKGRAPFDDGAPRTWLDPEGVTRYHCEFRPEGAGSSSRRPLLLFFAGSGGSASNAYDYTSLRAKAVSHDLTDDPARPGFLLVCPQARNLHWPTDDPQDGSKFDSYYRDVASPSTNADVRYADHLIDHLVQAGAADPSRIYLSGWSNGARFAAFYGIARHATPTPGENRVAAVAVYSGGDPFENIRDAESPSCKMSPYPTSTLPFFLVSRSCDAVACDPSQDAGFRSQGFSPAPGNVARTWIRTLREVVGDPNAEWAILNGRGETVTECAPAEFCTMTSAMLNHVRWPDGVADGGGVDHEAEMLAFLRRHPLR